MFIVTEYAALMGYGRKIHVPVSELEVNSFVSVFIFINTLGMQAAIALAWLCKYAGLSETWLPADAISIKVPCTITWLFAYSKGGNIDIYIWVWFGYFIC